MKIKEVEQQTGITVKNIRFYEEQGLLTPRRNDENSYREYEPEDIRRIKLIKVLRKLDMPLELIRRILTGETPLNQAVTAHLEHLEQSIRTLESAQRVCKELASSQTAADELDVDACLSQMAEMEESDSNGFTDILNDFLLVAKSVEKTSFHFFPDELVTTPEEFSDALFQYAQGQKKEIIITKKTMYPEFIMDGIEYTAMRYTFPAISVEALHPELLEPEGVSKGRFRLFRHLLRLGIPMALIALVMFIMLLYGRGYPGGSLALALVTAPVVAIVLYKSYGGK